MTHEVRAVNFILVIIGLVISLVGLLQVRINRNIEERTRAFFTALFSILSVYILCLLTRELTYYMQGYGWVLLSRIVFFGQALLAALLALILTAFLLYQSGEEKWWRSGLFKVSFGLWGVYAAILVYNLFTGIIYFVDIDNSYHRGPLYPILMVPTALITCINLYGVWKNRKKLSDKAKNAFVVYSAVPMIAMVIQARVFGVHFIALSSVISAIFMLTNIISDQAERFYMKEAENAKLKLDILQSQIQPHFLYNSLTTIKHLCTKDPQTASDAIEQFMIYLRHNMDSLTADRPIDFLTELDHVKGYLALQKLRFGDDLSVIYDLQFIDFKMPPLTLQPLVENAVTYGIRKNATGKGTVTISTRRTENTVDITVEDDGPGFEISNVSADNTAHIGIMNVRKRVEDIVGGELIIDSETGRGTKATIRLGLGVEEC